ncbi:ABC transporter ATP-binding protein [Haliangium ochraceum]|uniref:ABC transporter related protein n=1 Tax=Haliangium ochraceum (strain DSM 14365 / JCM 11303 / SMP-2) TaxID=502025 RepID=D0LQE8_HALO1|nr:ABC transporter related protein [Haliangium ochraceum DSM 14365]
MPESGPVSETEPGTESAAATPVLALSEVVKDYGDEVVTRVLRGVDFELGAGEFTALVGPSGSGKSTLLNILGLLDTPTAGSVRVLGTEIAGLDDAALTELRGRRIGFVFQFHHLVPSLTAAENVAMPLAIAAGRMRRDLRARAAEVLAEVGLAGREDAKPAQLSGGQQQRVAIARALIARPPLILADEPTGNLDTRTADEVFALMRRFNREAEIAFLIVTHDPRLAERCDRVIELVDGRIASDTGR